MSLMTTPEATAMLNELTGRKYDHCKLPRMVRRGTAKATKGRRGNTTTWLWSRKEVERIAEVVRTQPVKGHLEDGPNTYLPTEEEIYRKAAERRAMRSRETPEDREYPVEIRIIDSSSIV